MTLDDLIEQLTTIKNNHEYYGKLNVVRITKKDNQQDLVDIEVKIKNTRFAHTDGVILKFE